MFSNKDPYVSIYEESYVKMKAWIVKVLNVLSELLLIFLSYASATCHVWMQNFRRAVCILAADQKSLIWRML